MKCKTLGSKMRNDIAPESIKEKPYPCRHKECVMKYSTNSTRNRHENLDSHDTQKCGNSCYRRSKIRKHT